MTCWWGWYTVNWAEASPMLNTSKERTGRIVMTGEMPGRNFETSAQRRNLEAAVREKERIIL